MRGIRSREHRIYFDNVVFGRGQMDYSKEGEEEKMEIWGSSAKKVLHLPTYIS